MTPKQLDKVENYTNVDGKCYYSGLGTFECMGDTNIYYCKEKKYNQTYTVHFCWYHYKNFKKYAVLSKLSEKDLFYLRINGII